MTIYIFTSASSAWVRKNFVVVRADRRSLFKTSSRKPEITKSDYPRRIHSV